MCELVFYLCDEKARPETLRLWVLCVWPGSVPWKSFRVTRPSSSPKTTQTPLSINISLKPGRSIIENNVLGPLCIMGNVALVLTVGDCGPVVGMPGYWCRTTAGLYVWDKIKSPKSAGKSPTCTGQHGWARLTMYMFLISTIYMYCMCTLNTANG